MSALILDSNTQECRHAIWTHRFRTSQTGDEHHVYPVERYDGTNSRQIVFQTTASSGQKSAPQAGHIWLQTLRLYSLTASLSPSLVLLAWIQGAQAFGLQSWNYGQGTLASLGVLFIQIAINQLNEVRKHLRFFLPDPEVQKSKDPSNPSSLLSGRNSISPLRQGWISPSTLSKWGFSAALLGVLLGAPALFHLPGKLPFLTLTGAIGIFLYLGLEHRTSPRPGSSKDLKIFRDLLAGMLVGPALMSGLALAYLEQLPSELLWIGAALGTAASAIVHANNLQDIPDDLTLSSKSLASALGFRISKNLFGLLYAATILFVLVGTQSPTAALISLLLMVRPLSTLIRNVKNATGPTSPHLFGVRELAAQIHVRLALGLALHFAAFRLSLF
jgi:1,4-dihydroxy-2-naphthoate octaprenyltransferase